METFSVRSARTEGLGQDKDCGLPILTIQKIGRYYIRETDLETFIN